MWAKTHVLCLICGFLYLEPTDLLPFTFSNAVKCADFMWPPKLRYICNPNTDPARISLGGLFLNHWCCSHSSAHTILFNMVLTTSLSVVSVLFYSRGWLVGNQFQQTFVLLIFVHVKDAYSSIPVYSNSALLGTWSSANWTHLKPWSHMAGFPQGRMWN